MWQSFFVELGKQVCTQKQQLVFGILLSVVLMVLSLVSLTVVHPESATYVIVVLNLVSLSFITVIFSITILLCRRRDH